MSHIGIDYGLGLSNVDKETGIRYGVISQNSINLDCTEDFEYDYGKASCPTCGQDAIESSDETISSADWNEGKDYACTHCKQVFWSDHAFGDEPIGWSYQREGYQLTDCLTNDIFVLKSPYFTFAAYCSPCVPGAGNLDSPIEDGIKCYALGHDWFEDGKAPYPVYSVETGKLIEA